VDVDAAPQTAAAHGVRSIPTVLGIRDRTIRAEFVGAQPEPALRQFIESLLPSEADALAAEAAELTAGGEVVAAEERFRAALAKEARHGRALVGLARIRAAAGDVDEGLDLLAHVLPHETVADEAEHLAAELRVGREGDADPEALRTRVEAAPEDPAPRIALGRSLAAAGRHAEALEALLEAVRRDPEYEDGAARRAMLDLFEVLGGEHELTQRFRSELARALFR
jgi:putative thioredoxin